MAKREDTAGVALVTDSESLVTAQEGESTEGRLGELRRVLLALRQHNWTMKLLWIPGDYVLGGNERADEEAKRGGRMEQKGVLWSRKTRIREMESRVNFCAFQVVASSWRKRERSGNFPPMRPGSPYSGQTQERTIDMPPGTTECPRCSRAGNLTKQRVGKSTLGAHLVWAGLPPVLVGVGTEEGGGHPRSAVSGQEEINFCGCTSEHSRYYPGCLELGAFELVCWF